MPPTLNDCRQKIARLKSKGVGLKKIVQKFKDEANIQLSLPGAKKVWKSFNESGTLANKNRFLGEVIVHLAHTCLHAVTWPCMGSHIG